MLAACNAGGRPEHLGIAAFDSIDLLRGFRPLLTSVVQPSYETGDQGASLLLDRIEGADKGAQVVVNLPCELRIGESSRPRKWPAHIDPLPAFARYFFSRDQPYAAITMSKIFVFGMNPCTRSAPGPVAATTTSSPVWLRRT